MPAVNNGTMCGYWTFVPIFREVCGTRTFGDDCPTKSQTKENVCGLGAQRQPVLSPMGLPNALAGETRFVQTDCNTHLPIDQSNGTTSNGTDSAPLPPDLRKYYTEFWRRSKNSQGGLPSTNLKYTSCSSPVGMPMNYDCLYAINMLSWNEQSSARFVKPANTAIHSKTSTVVRKILCIGGHDRASCLLLTIVFRLFSPVNSTWSWMRIGGRVMAHAQTTSRTLKWSRQRKLF